MAAALVASFTCFAAAFTEKDIKRCIEIALSVIPQKSRLYEDICFAVKIAEEAGTTRSIVVNAMRKLESAGILETRSSGMKGTYIKVLNEFLYNEIDNEDATK